jgi:hypothetical protein
MKLTKSALAVTTSTLAFAVMPCHAAGKAKIAHDKAQQITPTIIFLTSKLSLTYVAHNLR